MRFFSTTLKQQRRNRIHASRVSSSEIRVARKPESAGFCYFSSLSLAWVVVVVVSGPSVQKKGDIFEIVPSSFPARLGFFCPEVLLLLQQPLDLAGSRNTLNRPLTKRGEFFPSPRKFLPPSKRSIKRRATGWGFQKQGTKLSAQGCVRTKGMPRINFRLGTERVLEYGLIIQRPAVPPKRDREKERENVR